MLYAVRGNKYLKIEEKEKSYYLAQGFDIVEIDGKKAKTLETAPNKTVSYNKHQEALDKIAALEKELKALKKTQEKGDK